MNQNHQAPKEGWEPSFPMPSNDTYYAHTTEDIPLSKLSNDEKRSENSHYLSAQAENKRLSNSSIYSVQRSKVSLMAKPLFNIVLSSFFTISLLLLYLHADGKPIDYQIIDLKIPSLVSLVLTINIMFISSGIAMAVAEYKWIHLKNGAPLTIIDIYDSCTRGLSGFAVLFRALHFDWILLLAMILHLGLLAVGPASQEILVPIVNNYTTTGVGVRFYHFPANYTNDRNGLESSGMAPKLNGLAKDGYLTSTSFAQAANNVTMNSIFKCPSSANYCEFDNITYISNTMTCHNITENDTAIVNRDKTARYNIVLKEYFTHLNITFGQRTFPKFLYSSEMMNRTYYDLANYTAPTNALNITETLTSTTKYDPIYRPYVGEQIFVMAYNKYDVLNLTAYDYTDLAFKKCYFNSSLNTSAWKTTEGNLKKASDDSSVPIVLDFDNVIGNNVALNNLTGNSKNTIMVNAYIMQQALLKELIEPAYYTMYEYMRAWDERFSLNGSPNNIFEAFMEEAVAQFDYSFFQAPYVSTTYEPITDVFKEGTAYFSMKPQYSVNKGACYALSLSLFLPIVWWIIVWIISIKNIGGVARGNSQIALLATGMTPLAEHNLRGFSNLDAGNAFKRAKNIRVRVGTFTDDRRNRVAFGMEGEENLQALK